MNIILTACNSGLYFRSTEMLISSIHKYSFDLIDEIKVLDLGLTHSELQTLSSYAKTNVVRLTDEVKRKYFKEYWYLKKYGWKVYFNYITSNEYKYRYSNILWVDAGICFLKKLDGVFDILDKDHFFIVESSDLVEEMTTSTCLGVMDAECEDRITTGIQAGLVGHKSWGLYKGLIDDWYKYSKRSECLLDYGDDNHRWDQSILSVLSSQYNVDKYDIEGFLYWYGGDDPNSPHYHIQSRYGSTGYPENCLSLHHRGTYLTEYDNLIKYIEKRPTCRN